MYLIIFNGNLIRDKIIVMAKFEGNDDENLKKVLRSRSVLTLLREPEFIEFWHKTVLLFEFEFEFINDVISDISFEKVFIELEKQKIDIFPLLVDNYNKKSFDCIALIKDDNLLNIIRTCSNLLIDFDYPTFYY